MKKVAIFIDWENLRKDIEQCQKCSKHRDLIQFDYNSIDDIVRLVYQPLQHDEEIYRIFYYTAEPLSLELELKNSKNNDIKQSIQKLKNQSEKWEKHEKLRKKILANIEQIAFKDYFAVRLGKLKLQGFNKERPIINQKQVDMLLGLDIAHVAYQKLVDRILVFCKDTDIVPALKCARINGLQVCLAHLEEGFSIAAELKKHVDMIRKISLPQKPN